MNQNRQKEFPVSEGHQLSAHGCPSDLCSVICTTYNHEEFSGHAVKSIGEQIWTTIEAIIIDDGSTDQNVAVINGALAVAGIHCVLIEQKNTGNPAKNANRALRAARGEFCCLFSLDDLLLPDCISSKIDLMRQDPSLVMVGNSSNLEIVGGNRSKMTEVKNPIYFAKGSSPEEMLELEFSNIGTYLLQGTVFRTSFLRTVGGFDEETTGDDLNLRTKIWKYLIAHPECGFAFLLQPGFIYRRHNSNLNHNTYRQVMTVLDWCERYFPGRSLPEIAQSWLTYYFDRCYERGELAELQQVLASHAQARLVYSSYKKSARYHWQSFKLRIRRAFNS